MTVDDWDAVRDILASAILFPDWLIIRVLLPLGYKEEDIPSYVSKLSSVIRLSDFGHRKGEIEFFHASLIDFLCDRTRSGECHVDLEAFACRNVVTCIDYIHIPCELPKSLFAEILMN